MTEEEITALQGELEVAKNQVGELTTQLAERDAAFGPLQGELAEVKAQLTEKDEALTNAEATIEQGNAAIKEKDEALAGAMEAYKGTVLQANPDVIEELVKGETIEEIASSLENAKALVGKVRQGIEKELQGGTIPAGAPARTAPDLSGMSAREKIEYALGKEGE